MPQLPRDARDAADAMQAAGEALDRAKKAFKKYADGLDPEQATETQQQAAKALTGDIEKLSRSAAGLSERIWEMVSGR